MSLWWWLTPAGSALAVQPHASGRCDVIRALAAVQPGRTSDVFRRAERDGMRSRGLLKEVVDWHLWWCRGGRLVDVEKAGSVAERLEARAAAAVAPTLADAMALAVAAPMTIDQIVADLAAVGRADATEPGVCEVLAYAGPRFARIEAADGRVFYIRRRPGGTSVRGAGAAARRLQSNPQSHGATL